MDFTVLKGRFWTKLRCQEETLAKMYLNRVSKDEKYYMKVSKMSKCGKRVKNPWAHQIRALKIEKCEHR